jgi:hypothetical protein
LRFKRVGLCEQAMSDILGNSADAFSRQGGSDDDADAIENK